MHPRHPLPVAAEPALAIGTLNGRQKLVGIFSRELYPVFPTTYAINRACASTENIRDIADVVYNAATVNSFA